MSEESTCGARNGCKNPKSEPHTCPFQEDVNNDHEIHCDCCPSCEQECCDDI